MNKLPSIRRWGVAALTGVTLFGGLSIVGAGVASAASAPTVTAAFTGSATAGTIAGIAAAGSGGNLTLAVAGTPVVGDKITLTLACPSVGTASFGTITDTSADFGAVSIAGAGTCASPSTATFTATGVTANPTLALTLITYVTTGGVTSQALSISGTYSTFGLASTNFTVPTDANVVWFSEVANTPAVTLGASTTTAVSPISITEPQSLPADNLADGATIVLTLPVHDTWGGTPTLTAPNSTSSVAAPSGRVLTITVTTAPTAGNSGLWTLTNLAVTTTANSPVGANDVVITSTGPAQTLFASVSIGTIPGAVKTIYGADGTADGTVAAEFEAAFPGGNSTVVLATDVPHTNGSDALAASYLEGTLGTGLLITSPTALGSDAQLAMQLMGVKTVYVVGGPLAISPAVIAQIQALPAYNVGGLTTTGSNVKIVGPIYGADGTAAGTAAAIATYYSTAYGSGTFASAYSSTGGAYNDTTGSATATGPGTAAPTAIVVASSDWQDAMSIAPEAFNKRFPVVLTGPSTDTTLSAGATAALTSLGVKQVIVIGGQLALQNSVETQIAALNGGISVLRIAGIDATDTAAQIANFALSTANNGVKSGLGWNPTSVLASHVDYWTDALGAAALGSVNTQPMILVESPLVIGKYTTAELSVLAGAGVTGLTVLGGPLAMPSSTVQTLLAGL
jgi:putative cell wall-binding protein